MVRVVHINIYVNCLRNLKLINNDINTQILPSENDLDVDTDSAY